MNSRWRLFVPATAMLTLLSVVGWIISPASFYRSLLVGWLFCLGITLGAGYMVMLHHLVGGAWGFLVRRIGEHLGLTLPLLAVLALILMSGFGHLFPWAQAAFAGHDEVIQHRHLWSRPASMILRTVVSFVIWMLVAWKLRSSSLAQDVGDRSETRQASLGLLSRGGLVLAFITVSMLAVDWIMSREPHWYSTAFGLVIISSQAQCGIAALIILLRVYADHPEMRKLLTADRLQDLGNLLLTCMVLWAYISFAQFLVIWMGNLQVDITYVYQRSHFGWQVLTGALMLLNFGGPFVALLSQENKRDLKRLSRVAAMCLGSQLLFVYWLIAPTSWEPGSAGHLVWTDFIVIPATLLIWISFSLYWTSRTIPVPLYQPETMISHEFDAEATHA